MIIDYEWWSEMFYIIIYEVDHDNLDDTFNTKNFFSQAFLQ